MKPIRICSFAPGFPSRPSTCDGTKVGRAIADAAPIDLPRNFLREYPPRKPLLDRKPFQDGGQAIAVEQNRLHGVHGQALDGLHEI
jgi:hypothetical protein